MPLDPKQNTAFDPAKDTTPIPSGSTAFDPEKDTSPVDDVKKKVVPSPSPSTAPTKKSAGTSEKSVLDLVRGSLKGDIFSNLSPVVAPSTPEAAAVIKDSYMPNGLQKPIEEQKDKDILTKNILLSQTKHLFTSDPKYLDKEEQDKYYNSLKVSPKDLQDIKEQGADAAAHQEHYNMVRTLAYISPNAHNLSTMGDAQVEAGDYTTAMKTYHSAIEKYPNSPEGYIGASYLAANNKDYKTALGAINDAEKVAPTSNWVQAHKAQMLYATGDQTGAVNYINRAIQGSDRINDYEDLRNAVYAYQVRASIRRNSHNQAGATEDLNKAQQLQDEYKLNHFFETADKTTQAPLEQASVAGQPIEVQQKENTSAQEQQASNQDAITNPDYQGFGGIVKHPGKFLQRELLSAAGHANDLQAFKDVANSNPTDAQLQDATGSTDRGAMNQLKYKAGAFFKGLGGVAGLAGDAFTLIQPEAAIPIQAGIESAATALPKVAPWLLTPATKLGESLGANQTGWVKSLEGVGDALAQVAAFKFGGKALEAGRGAVSEYADRFTVKPDAQNITESGINPQSSTIDAVTTKVQQGYPPTVHDINKTTEVLSHANEKINNNKEYQDIASKSIEKNIADNVNANKEEYQPKVTEFHPDEVNTRFSQYLKDNYEEAKDRYKTANYSKSRGLFLGADDAKELSSDYVNDRNRLSYATQDPASRFIKNLYAEEVKQPAPDGHEDRVVFTAGGTGSGKTSMLKGDMTIPPPHMFYDGNLSNFGSAVKKIDLALNNGKKVNLDYVYRDPVDAYVNGVIPRMKKIGRAVSLEDHVDRHLDSYNVIQQLTEHYKGNKNVEVSYIDNSHGRGNARPISLEELQSKKFDANKIKNTLRNEIEQQRDRGELTGSQYEGLQGRGTKKSGTPEDSRAANVGSPESGNQGKQADYLNSGGRYYSTKTGDKVLLTNPSDIAKAKSAIKQGAEEPQKKVEPVLITKPKVLPTEHSDVIPAHINDANGTEQFAQARAVGFKNDGDNTYEQAPTHAFESGKETELQHADGTVKAKYVWLNPVDAINGHNNGMPNPRSFYPDAVPFSRLGLMDAEQKYPVLDPKQTLGSSTIHNGAPLINDKGYVLQGNGRNGIMNDYNFHTDPAGYYDYLKSNKDEHGFSEGSIEKNKEQGNALYRLVKGDDKSNVALGQEVERDLEQSSPRRVNAEQTHAKLNSDALNDIHDAMMSDKPDANVISAMLEHKIINPLDAGKLMSGSEVNSIGRQYVRNFLDNEIAVGGDNRMYDDVAMLPKGIKDNLSNAILGIHKLGEYSFLPEIHKAIALYSGYLNRPENMRDMSLQAFGKMPDEFGVSAHDFMKPLDHEFVNLLHVSNVQNIPENTFSLITDNITRILKGNPSYTKTDALNDYFGTNQAPSGLEYKNNFFNKIAYGKEQNFAGDPPSNRNTPESTQGTQGAGNEGGQDIQPPSGGGQPPINTNGPTAIGSGGDAGGKAPFDTKELAKGLYNKYLGNWATKYFDWYKSIDNKGAWTGGSENQKPSNIPSRFDKEQIENPQQQQIAPPLTRNDVSAILSGTFGVFRQYMRAIGDAVKGDKPQTDILDSYNVQKTGAESSLLDSFAQIMNDKKDGLYNKYPELATYEGKLRVYDWLNKGGDGKDIIDESGKVVGNNIPKEFSEGETALVHTIDQIRDGSAEMAQQLRGYDAKNKVFSKGKLDEIIDSHNNYLKRIPFDFLDSNVREVLNSIENKSYKQAKVATGNANIGQWILGGMKDEFVLDPKNLKRGKLNDPGQLFKTQTYLKATDENGVNKIVHVKDNGDIHDFTKVGASANPDAAHAIGEEQQNTDSFESHKFGSYSSKADLMDNGFQDINGKHWNLSKASVDEIEQGSNQRYLKDPMMSAMHTYRGIFQILNETKLFDSLKNEPLFKDKIITLTDENKVPYHDRNGNPANVSQLDLEQAAKDGNLDNLTTSQRQAQYKAAGLPDNAFKKQGNDSYVPMEGLSPLFDNVRFKRDIVDTYHNAISATPASFDKASRAFLNIALTPMLLGAGHAYNVAEGFGVNMLKFNDNFKAIGGIPKYTEMAFRDIRDQNDRYKFAKSMGHIFIDQNDKYTKWLKEEFAPSLMAHDPVFVRAMNEMGGNMDDITKQSDAINVAGYSMNDINDIKQGLGKAKEGIRKFEAAMAWIPQNISNYAQMLYELERKGYDLNSGDFGNPDTQKKFQDAISDNNKKIITYKIPSYVGTTKKPFGMDIGYWLSNAMKNKSMLMFSGYDLGKLKVLMNDAKAVMSVKGGAPDAENLYGQEAMQRMLVRAGLLYAHHYIQNQMQQNPENTSEYQKAFAAFKEGRPTVDGQGNKIDMEAEFRQTPEYEQIARNIPYRKLRLVGDLKPTSDFVDAVTNTLKNPSHGLDEALHFINQNFTPSSVISNAMELHNNQDYMGQPIYDEHDNLVGKKGVDMWNHIVGGDNTTRVRDGFLQEAQGRPGAAEKIKEGVFGIIAPANYVKYSPAEAKVATEMRNSTAMEKNIKDAKTVALTNRDSDLHQVDLDFDKKYPFKYSPDGQKIYHTPDGAPLTEQEIGDIKQKLYLNLPKDKTLALVQKWYSTMYKSEGEILPTAKAATEEMIKDLKMGGTTPTQNLNMPRYTDQMVQDYNDAHPYTQKTGDELTMAARVEAWERFEATLDKRIEARKYDTPDNVLDLVKKTVGTIKEQDIQNAQYEAIYNKAIQEEDWMKQLKKYLKGGFTPPPAQKLVE